MKQIDGKPEEYRRLVKRRDILAVCVFPHGKKLLLIRLFFWQRFFLAATSVFLVYLALWAFNWDWRIVIVMCPGAILAYLGIMIYPQTILSDPEKSSDDATTDH